MSSYQEIMEIFRRVPSARNQLLVATDWRYFGFYSWGLMRIAQRACCRSSALRVTVMPDQAGRSPEENPGGLRHHWGLAVLMDRRVIAAVEKRCEGHWLYVGIR